MKALYSIVATKFIPGAEEAIKHVATGSVVLLVREPDNPADPNAVAVWSDNVKIGYLPKAKNLDVGRLIDKHGKPWSQPTKVGAFADDAGDVTVARAIKGKLLRSPNSGWPQVEVDE